MQMLEHHEDESDDCDNSFGENASYGEEDEDDDDDEESPDKIFDSQELLKNEHENEDDEEEDEADEDDEESPVLRKKPQIKNIFEKIEEPQKPYKERKNVINVFCTEYDIVRRVAKRILNYRLKEYEEDHDGAIRNGEGNQKLSADWDISFHDLGITADFLSKMQPWQKVNQYPGMYVITRKNYLARNLMKMQRAFPE